MTESIFDYLRKLNPLSPFSQGTGVGSLPPTLRHASRPAHSAGTHLTAALPARDARRSAAAPLHIPLCAVTASSDLRFRCLTVGAVLRIQVQRYCGNRLPK